MKQVVYFILLFVPVSLVSQNNSKIDNRFSIGVLASVDYTNTSLSSDGSSMANYIVESLKTAQKPKAGFTTGISCLYEFKDIIGLEVGALFANRGTIEDWGWQELEGIDTIYFYSFRSVYSQYYVDFPIKIRVNILKFPFRLFASTGISPNIEIQERQRSYVKQPDGEEKVTKSKTKIGYTSFDLQIIGSIGVEYFISNKLRLRFEPTFRHSLLSPKPFDHL